MTLRTALAQGVKLLSDGGIDAPKLTAEVLLAHALRRDRVYLVAHANDELTELGWIHYGRYLHERLKGKPTQYITKQQEFYGRMFRVEPGVLIPRPETELLCEAVLERLPAGARVADVGTGSGCIAVTLALEGRAARVFAVDFSADALRIARRNAVALGAEIGFVQGDLLGSFAGGSLDAVVSNPPYVPEPDRDGMAREVRDWEPETALFAGADGLDIYRRLIPESARVLRRGGRLAMEFGFGQAEAMRGLLAGWRDVEIRNDLAGIPRMALATLD